MRNKPLFFILILFGGIAVYTVVFTQQTHSSWRSEVLTPVEENIADNQELTVVLDYYRSCTDRKANLSQAIANACLTETAEFVERLQLPASAFGLMRQLAINNTAFWRSGRE
ncbi:hypothetical protein SAMN05428964_10547 [Thalassospira xiamenensis]|uniref:Uncharacterized protein n=2 Tax=Thalassospira xiamenensis TaxID=220697 RepID=A0A285TSV1_9PROT|nr:hypothetical protein SAMN05428964_10547 [Thalassospira xiamenensis]